MEQGNNWLVYRAVLWRYHFDRWLYYYYYVFLLT